MKIIYPSGTGVSATYLLARALPVIAVCLLCLLLPDSVRAFEMQTLNQTTPVAALSGSHSPDGRLHDDARSNFSCAIFLNRAERGAEYTSASRRVQFTAEPTSSLGLVVGIRVALGSKKVTSYKRSAFDFWRPSAGQDSREQALSDYQRCKSGRSLTAHGSR